MEKLINIITKEVIKGFSACGYDEAYGQVTVSNRPDLCQYQCNGSLSAAKLYKKAPIAIANEVVSQLKDNTLFESIEAIAPGFINMNISSTVLTTYMKQMSEDTRLGCELTTQKKTIVVDYGGANVAKPLHVGHMRSAVIGESIKRIYKFMGHEVIGDAHLGDWGLPMGLIIVYLKEKEPQLPYFNENFQGQYPEDAPFTISELEMIYPMASKRSKIDDAFLQDAQDAVFKLQNGHQGYYALWQHIINVSVSDIKRVYTDLNVFFELWKKESDARPYIPDMVQYMKEEGFAHISEGALVVDVKEETDTKEMPPCMILKSNGATLYDTTDLATIVERVKLFNPDQIIYIVDKRQELYFERIFRCSRKTGLVKPHVELNFLGFGTMNGKDGKPFKTRDGGIMRLDDLIGSVNEEVFNKIMSNREIEEDEARSIAKKVALAALKYGDLSNQATKDYVFDMDRFTSFEGNTGPYVLYTMVRIKSILGKYKESNPQPVETAFMTGSGTYGKSETDLMLTAVRFNDMMEHAAEEMAPHKICQYIFELANALNTFYHENKIIAEENKEKQKEWISMILLVLRIFELCIDVLAIEAPEKM